MLTFLLQTDDLIRRQFFPGSNSSRALDSAASSHPDVLPVIEPLREINLPGRATSGIVIAPDGQTAYVELYESGVNLWALTSYFWPELLGAVAIIAVLLFAAKVSRVLRHKQIVGQPLCRRCGFCLTGLATDCCPECGDRPSRRKPLLGRSAIRRIMPAAITCAVILGLCAWPWVFGSRRKGRFGWWFEVWSVEVPKTEWVKKWGFVDRAVKDLTTSVTTIAEYDLDTGALRRTIKRLVTGANVFGLTPDGRQILVAGRLGQSLNLIRISDGKTLRGIRPPTSPAGDKYAWCNLAGIAEDNSSAFVVALDRKARTAALLQVGLDDGQTRVLFEQPASERTNAGKTFPTAPTYFLVPGDSPRRVVELVDDTRPSATGPGLYNPSAFARLLNIDAEGEVIHEFPSVFWPDTTPAFSADGRLMFLQDRLSYSEPSCWELQSGKTLLPPEGELGQDGTVTFQGRLRRFTGISLMCGSAVAFDPSHDRVFAASLRGTGLEQEPWQLGVFDRRAQKWIARCRYPLEVSPGELHVTAEGRRLIVEGLTRPAGQSLQKRLVIYDVGSL